MKIKIVTQLAFIMCISLALGSCEFKSFDEYEPADYDGAFEWTREIKNAEWGNRFDHAAAVYDGKIWIVAGYNPGIVKGDTYYEDVWSSENGIIWEEMNSNADFHGRRGHELITFNDGSGEALFLIGGFEVNEETGYRQYTNDVWKSTDGVDWQMIKERDVPPVDSLYTWYPRMEHSCIVKEVDGTDYIYLIAGRTMQENFDGRYSTKYFSDVWRSSDAINWERVANNDFGERCEQAVAIHPQSGRLYLQGGIHGYTIDAAPNSTHPVDKWEYIWYSDDGEEWIAINDTASFNQSLLFRAGHQMLYYENSFWTLPGKTTSTLHYLFTNSNHYTIWAIDETGIYVDSYGDAFDPRHGYETVIFQDKVWILGGFTSSNGQNNDIWSGVIK